MAHSLPTRMSQGQLELLYLIGEGETPYDIYFRSAMTIQRQRLVLARLQDRFNFQSIDDVKDFYQHHQTDIYLRLEQLGSFAIDPCGGPGRRNGHPEPSTTEQDLWDAAEIIRKLDEAGLKNL